jgi:hypothetical protein
MNGQHISFQYLRVHIRAKALPLSVVNEYYETLIRHIRLSSVASIA